MCHNINYLCNFILRNSFIEILVIMKYYYKPKLSEIQMVHGDKSCFICFARKSFTKSLLLNKMQLNTHENNVEDIHSMIRLFGEFGNFLRVLIAVIV